MDLSRFSTELIETLILELAAQFRRIHPSASCIQTQFSTSDSGTRNPIGMQCIEFHTCAEGRARDEYYFRIPLIGDKAAAYLYLRGSSFILEMLPPKVLRGFLFYQNQMKYQTLCMSVEDYRY